MSVVSLYASGNDRFYIEDFTISPGETLTVSILLENEAAYTAFQTDIYFPEGLTVEQEDEEYIFDLTARKSRDHNIATQLQKDGSIRLISYSPKINAYKGNSGPLVTFILTAADDFAGPASIQLKKSLFTTVEGNEVAMDNETCTVTTPAMMIMGDVDGDGSITIADVVALIDMLLENCTNIADYPAADYDGDGLITVADVTALIDHLLYY